jgi:hypothetical protein
MMGRIALVAPLTLALVGCKSREAPRPGPVAPAPPAAPKVEPVPITAPLDPAREEAMAGNRDALDRMARSVGCPAKAPSQFARWCVAASEFATGTSDGLADGEVVLIGEAAIIEPGPPGMATLGTPRPVVLRLKRDGAKVSAAQRALRDVADADAMPIALGRIDHAIDGTWDHVDVPNALEPQLTAIAAAPLDPLELAGDAFWPQDLDGMELRRANGHWIAMGAPQGPDGIHVFMIFADKMRVLGPKEASPQTIKVLHL